MSFLHLTSFHWHAKRCHFPLFSHELCPLTNFTFTPRLQRSMANKDGYEQKLVRRGMEWYVDYLIFFTRTIFSACILCVKSISWMPFT